MIFATWLRHFPSRFRRWSRPSRSDGLYLYERRFRFEVEREQVRSDRSGLPLSLLVIRLPIERARQQDVDFLAGLLTERLRITDTIGNVGPRTLGALLPDTPASGAWKVASDVCGVYPVGHDRPDCEVYGYPEESALGPVSAEAEPPAVDAPTAKVEVGTLFVRDTPLSKRLVDITGASVGLALATPLFGLIAVAIKLTSRGPAIYRQEREGLGGKRFWIYKFRTMRLGAEQQQADLRQYSEQDGPAFKMSRDPRTTWVGRWLRRTSLDELPQLWNVLCGEMSLVGPRPLPTAESLQCARWQRRRLAVTPGMTCIWQIWGRNTIPFDDWMRMDLQYVRRRSFGYDLRLLVKTPPALVLKSGPRRFDA